MRILAVIQHRASGAGVFADVIAAGGHELDEWVAIEGPPARPLSEYDAIMAFGGSQQADEDERFPWLRSVLEVRDEGLRRELPMLGVCLGAQLLARVAGGAVGPAKRAEWAWQTVELTDAGIEDPLFEGEPRTLEVFESHSYACELPPGAVALARNPVCLQAFRVGERAWGVQWHPEVTAESVLIWGRQNPPATKGVPVKIDLAQLEATVSARMAQTNHEGRELCGRFLRIAQAARGSRTREPAEV
jgi:GMP synthase (glutamine-hydrolysing)